MSAHVLLNLSSESRKRDKMLGVPSILSLFCNEFNKPRLNEHSCEILFILSLFRNEFNKSN